VTAASVGRTASAPASTGLRTVIARRVLAPVTVAIAIVTVVVGAVRVNGAEIPLTVQLVPFMFSILMFGLPHGSLDHLVPARLRGDGRVLRSVVVVVALYAVLGAATAALWLVAPLAGMLAFIALTWFHWGQGDRWIDHLMGDGTVGGAAAALTIAARGALPMLVPLVAHPADYSSVVSEAATVVGRASSTPVGVLTVTPEGRAVAGAIALALVVALIVAVRRTGRPVGRTVSEVVVLAAFFWVVPPVLAVGLYFTLWHSVRHIVRLELTDPTGACSLAEGRLLRPFVRFLRQAWPITVIALAILIGTGVLLGSDGLSVYLVVLAVLTTPHAAVVTWMDRVQGAWTGRRAAGIRLDDRPASRGAPRGVA